MRKLKLLLLTTVLLMLPMTAQAEQFKTTAYCACRKCCGKWANGKTATGTTPTQGRTIAVDKREIPLGTHVLIDGVEYIAEDTGVRGKHIDIFFNSHSEALKYGVKYVEVDIKEENEDDTEGAEEISGDAGAAPGEPGDGSDDVLADGPADSGCRPYALLTEEEIRNEIRVVQVPGYLSAE